MLQLYNNIKKRRIELGITQQELAELIGYTCGKSMISKIESGKVDLPQSKIKQFAVVLKTSPGDLMGWDQEQINTIVAKQKEISDQIDRMENELKSNLVKLTTEQLSTLNDILNLNLDEEEMLELLDYARYLLGKRKN